MKLKLKAASMLTMGALALLGAQPALAADPLILESGDSIKIGYGTYQESGFNGGEFLATGTSLLNGWNGSFATFCLETNEYFTPGGTYSVHLNTEAVAGGNGTAGIGSWDLGPSTTGDPLSNATAWLYTQYRTNPGALTGWNGYSAVNARDIQNAIWYLENEPSALDSNAQTWADQAINNVRDLHWVNPGNVWVLNLGPGAVQDMLYLDPVPEPETCLMLLAGLGMLGFIVRRRKLSDASH